MDKQELGAGMKRQELPGCPSDVSPWQRQGLLEPYDEELEKNPGQLTGSGENGLPSAHLTHFWRG